jgi:hypothetical protein
MSGKCNFKIFILVKVPQMSKRTKEKNVNLRVGKKGKIII